MKQSKHKDVLIKKIKRILFGRGNISAKEMFTTKAWVQPVIKIVTFVWMICFIIYCFVSLQQYRQLNNKYEKMTIEVERLQKENNSLKEQKKALETKEEIERIARKELGLVKAGETPYIK